MKITKATMEVVNADGRPDPAHETVKLKGGLLDLQVRERDGRKVAEVRLHVEDASRAEEEGQESSDPFVLLDWFLVHDADLTIHGGTIRLSGYMYGAKGARRDGASPYGHGKGNAYMDTDEPLVRVEWRLR